MGVAGICEKIYGAQQLAGKILSRKELAARRCSKYSAFASPMIADLICGGKVRCHMAAVEMEAGSSD